MHGRRRRAHTLARHARTRGPQAEPRQAVTPRQATQGPLCVKPSSPCRRVKTSRRVTAGRRPCVTLAHYAPSAQRVTPRMRHATHRALCAYQPARIMPTHGRARGPLRASQVPITNRRQSRARSKCVASARSRMEFAMVARGCRGRGFCERNEWGYYRGVRVWLSRIFWRGGVESWRGAWKNMEIIFLRKGVDGG